jgi:adenylate kinase family enzyme
LRILEPERVGRETARRISIVGTTGSGKSHLAARLADVTRLPLIHMDELRNDASGKKLSDDKFRSAVSEVIGGDDWIVDGYYRSVSDLIWPRADMIVWLDYPISFIMSRLFTRYLRKQTRRVATKVSKSAHVTAGSPSVGNNASWRDRMARFSRGLQEKSRYETLLTQSANADAKIIRLSKQGQVDDLIKGFAAAAGADAGQSGLRETGPLHIVELFGLPGAGKTTLVNALKLEGLDFRTRRDLVSAWADLSVFSKSYYALRGLANPTALYAALSFAMQIRRLPPENWARLFRLLAKSYWVRSRKGVYVMHQGLLQDVWSIFYGVRPIGVSHKALERLIAALFRQTPLVILYLDVSPEVSAARVSERTHGNGRVDRLSKAAADEKLREAQWPIQKILEAAAVLGITVIRIDTADSQHAVAQAAASELRAILF